MVCDFRFSMINGTSQLGSGFVATFSTIGSATFCWDWGGKKAPYYIRLENEWMNDDDACGSKTGRMSGFEKSKRQYLFRHNYYDNTETCRLTNLLLTRLQQWRLVDPRTLGWVFRSSSLFVFRQISSACSLSQVSLDGNPTDYVSWHFLFPPTYTICFIFLNPSHGKLVYRTCRWSDDWVFSLNAAQTIFCPSNNHRSREDSAKFWNSIRSHSCTSSSSPFLLSDIQQQHETATCNCVPCCILRLPCQRFYRRRMGNIVKRRTVRHYPTSSFLAIVVGNCHWDYALPTCST